MPRIKHTNFKVLLRSSCYFDSSGVNSPFADWCPVGPHAWFPGWSSLLCFFKTPCLPSDFSLPPESPSSNPCFKCTSSQSKGLCLSRSPPPHPTQYSEPEWGWLQWAFLFRKGRLEGKGRHWFRASPNPARHTDTSHLGPIPIPGREPPQLWAPGSAFPMRSGRGVQLGSFLPSSHRGLGDSKGLSSLGPSSVLFSQVY